jgi:hypothetical protein
LDEALENSSATENRFGKALGNSSVVITISAGHLEIGVRRGRCLLESRLQPVIIRTASLTA